MPPNASRLIQLLALISITVLTWPYPGLAAIRTVTNFGDTTPGGASGQLRFEINEAALGDTIVIPAETITVTGAAGEDANASGDLDITKNLTIQGAGPGATIIDGGGIDRVFEIFAGTVTISGMTIRNGNAGATGVGGAIRNDGTLTLTNSTVSGNTAGLRGGGIYNQQGTATLTNVTVSGNAASESGGGIANNNSSDATLTLSSVIVSNNTAASGGGISAGGTVTLSSVTDGDVRQR